ncbi:MAG: zinc-ribbon domain-containing protein [Pseudomonadales bacterium]|nr:zinc-ribbon domain-containing protein [Pseudomonadales bacterium]
MLILIGERTRGKATPSGTRLCHFCNSTQSFSHVTETSYFCLFGVPLLPIEKLSDYHLCEQCGSAYEQLTSELPAHTEPVRAVTAYILAGYGMQHHPELAREVAFKISGSELSERQLRQLMNGFETDQTDVFRMLRAAACHMNVDGRLKVVEAAFLMTHACCEIQYEDRLRVNLIGNSLGFSLHDVETAIEKVRLAAYFGVRRVLPTQPHLG